MKKAPSGYHTPSGFVGFLPNGRKMLFATDREYYEYLGGGEQEEKK
ncbi:MAG: hypothetical protein IJ418_16690 [Clostridia bacterium]|nr:hypothetical protein [Clostridia bacterium]